jgi:hypothetical protein
MRLRLTAKRGYIFSKPGGMVRGIIKHNPIVPLFAWGIGPMRFQIAGFATLLCFWLPQFASAQVTDPLRLIPGSVDGVAKVENPRALFEIIYNHEVFRDFMKIDAVAAFYDSTKFRQFSQFIAYFEKELGRNRMELLQGLTGGGVVLAGQIEQKSVLIVLGAKDEDLLIKAFALGRKIVNQELARQNIPATMQARPYRELETWYLGKEFYVARAGSALVFSNKEPLFKNALDLFVDGGKKSLTEMPSFLEMKGRLPENALIWGSLNLEQIKQQPNVKNTLNTLGLEPITMFAIGGLVDVIKRSDYVCAGLAQEGKNLQVRIALPKGRNGMASLAAMFLPEDDHGTLPILEPARVLTSTSYFLDLNKFWENRQKILTPEQAKTIDKFQADTGKYLRGIGVGTILQQSGKGHRIVTAVPGKSPYQIKPSLQTGSFAIVLDMRDPGFEKSMSTILRGAALIGSFQLGLKMVDEKHGDHTLVTYYFPENGKLEGDVNNLRFNFTPCFTRVGDQFLISSTLELGKDLVDCLVKENKQKTSPATQRTHIYATGVAANLRSSEDLLVSQAILSQALPAQTAKKQFEDLVRLVERLGQLNLETRYGPEEFRFDIEWQFEKK